MAPKLAPTQGRQRETGERKQATPDGQAAGPICKGTCRQGLVSAATRRTDFHAHQPDSSVYVETPAGLSHVQMGSAADCSHKSGVLENSAGRMCIPRWGGGSEGASKCLGPARGSTSGHDPSTATDQGNGDSKSEVKMETLRTKINKGRHSYSMGRKLSSRVGGHLGEGDVGGDTVTAERAGVRPGTPQFPKWSSTRH